MTLTIDLETATRFIEVLTGDPGTAVTWQTFDDAKSRGRRGRNGLARVLHGPLADVAETLASLSAEGAGVFLCVAATNLRGRTARDVVGLRALFVDKDDGPLPADADLPMPPSMRVRREGRGEHAYWLLRPSEDVGRLRGAQRRLAAYYASDPTVCDLPRVMRVPGYPHQKDPSAPAELVLTVHDAVRRGTIDEVLAAHPAEGRRGAVRLAARLTELRGIWPGETAHDALLAATTELAALEREGALAAGWDEALARVACVEWAEPMDQETLDALVVSARERAGGLRDGDLVCGERGPLATTGNAMIALARHPDWAGALGYDEFRDVVTWRRPVVVPGFAPTVAGAALAEHDLVLLEHALAGILRKKFGLGDVLSAAVAVARARPHHPVRDYLEGCLPWDGVPRLSDWLARYAGAEDTDHARRVSRWFLVSAVARVMEPGCKTDHMLLLIGRQGIGKSTVAATLAGQAWFRDGLSDLRTKDAELDLAGVWFVEIAELEALRNAEQELIKAYVARRVSDVRPPYGRIRVSRPRQCVFVGTTNDETPLRDPTGGRRFWPIHCGSADVEGLRRDRDQLWAEAVEAYAAGERWWPDDSEEHRALWERQEHAYQGDTWEDVVRRWLAARPAPGASRPGVFPMPALGEPPWTTAELLEHVIRMEPSRQGRRDQTRLSLALRRLGWAKSRPQSSSPRAWSPPIQPTREGGENMN